MAGQGRRPAVVEGLVCKEPPAIAWQDGERERWWARAAALDHGRELPGWDAAAARADRVSDLTAPQLSWLIAKGPEGPARAMLGRSMLLSYRHRQRVDVGLVAVARFELDALTFALGEAQESPDRLGLLVLPLRAPEVATLVAGWLRHLGSARLWARLWLERHAEAAAQALIPAAAGRPGAARQRAWEALRFLTGTGHRPTILEAAAGYGADAVAVIAAGQEPSAARKGRPPEWTRPERLPELRLAAGGPMPHDEVARLVGALARSRLADPPEPPPGDPVPRDGAPPVAVESSTAVQPLVQAADPEAERLVAACDRRCLAAFGRALLDGWMADGMPPSDAWVVPAQAHVGDDATMDMLAPLVRSWSGTGRWARSIAGLAVLATVGTDGALRHVLAMEERISAGPTKDRVNDYLTQAAARRGLSVPRLADRLAVTHGLDAGVTLDYGPRTFTVVTDEHLTAFAVGADGRPLVRPPRPGVRDTNPEAYQQFLRLKKDLQATAAAQAARLERDMFAHRLRPARDVAAVLLPHPVLGPLARRLLWAQYDPPHRLIRALRIAEDGSFADIHDTSAAVDDDAQVGIVHPAELGGDLVRWANLFADYEILQPFPQVHRSAVALTGAQRAATSLAGFGPVPTDRVLELLNRGRWHGNGFYIGQRLHTQLSHELPGGLTLLVELDPGVAASAVNTVDEQRITEIWADHSWSDHWQSARRIPMGRCDPAALSEALVELSASRG